MQDLIRAEEILAALPLTASSFEAGQLSAAHVRALGRVATVESERIWLARARRMEVRSLRRAVAAALAREEAAGEPGAAVVGAGGDAGLLREDGSQHPDGIRASGAVPPGRDQEDDEPDLRPVSISAPVWVIGWWRDAMTLARRLAGSTLPHGAALETVLSESQDIIGSVTGPAGGSEAGRLQEIRAARAASSGRCEDSRECPQVDPTYERGTAGSPGEVDDLPVPGDAPASAPNRRRWRGDVNSASNLDPSATADSAAGSQQDPACVGKGLVTSARPSMTRPAAPSPEACALDAELRRLVTERQRVEAALAERLGMDRAAGAHFLDGSGSFERYASRRYGISPRRIYYLLSLQRTLERLSSLKRAYVSGRLTLRQTILVGKVATRRTAPAWIRRAERTTLRRLEDEVEYWELLRVERPEAWERLKGHPLPDGIVLVPGHAPRLHAFASRCSSGKPPSPMQDDSPNDMHSFERRETDDGDGIPESFNATGEGRCASAEGNDGGNDETRPDLHAFASRSGLAQDDPTGGLQASARVETRVRNGCSASLGNDGGDDETRPDLHAFARPEVSEGWVTGTADAPPIDAWSFIEALGASVAATPLPARMGVLRMRVEPEILQMWHDTVSRFRALSSEPLEEWEVLVLALRRFFHVWDNKETRRQRREHPILERDGWRCAFPGCRSVGTGRLQTHHVLYRSHGGTDDDPGLLAALCNAHHLHLLHQGYIRCSGRAPDALVWELGTGGNLPAWRIYQGDVLAGGRALMPTAAAMGIAM